MIAQAAADPTNSTCTDGKNGGVMRISDGGGDSIISTPAENVAPRSSQTFSSRLVAGTRSVQVVAPNLSDAWIDAFDALLDEGIHSLEPLVVTVTGFDEDNRPIHTPAVAALIDEELAFAHKADRRKATRQAKRGPLTVAMAASTIFPESLWNPAMSRAEFYRRYMRLLPRLKRYSLNRRGIYFERLIAYGRGPEGGNQLEHMFRAFETKVKRTSAYQASVADPETDLTKMPLQGFPCLQQIAVHPSERDGTLAITGFYGTQYLLARGYGNFLGLCGLGRFIAHEMGLRLARMTCIASYAPQEATKARGRSLVMNARRVQAQSA